MKDLITNIEELESTGASQDEIDVQKYELQNYRNKIIEGIMIRSKSTWIRDGEKPTQYFCNMENRHFASKQIKC